MCLENSLFHQSTYISTLITMNELLYDINFDFFCIMLPEYYVATLAAIV